LPEASRHDTVIVYSRPFPLSDRSARSRRWCASSTCQSTLVLPSRGPLGASLLETDNEHDGAPDASVAPYPTSTSIIL
jgi:hypothetical protein